MSQANFPSGVDVVSFTPRPVGRRLDDFVNVDGEPFARPSLAGHWQIDMQLASSCVQSSLALSGFVTAMKGNATTVVPLHSQMMPEGFTTRPGPAEDYGPDNTGFSGQPYEGIRLDGAMAARDSFINIKMSRFFQLFPGMLFSIGDSLYQIQSFSHRGESDTKFQLHIWPYLRSAASNNTVVSFDRPRLKVRMRDGDDPTWDGGISMRTSCTFVEAL